MNATARFFQSLYRQYLVVAARLTVDLLFGRQPVHPRRGRPALLRPGLGGGLRLQRGEDFIIAFDVAHSPADDNLGIYVGAYHAF